MGKFSEVEECHMRQNEVYANMIEMIMIGREQCCIPSTLSSGTYTHDTDSTGIR